MLKSQMSKDEDGVLGSCEVAMKEANSLPEDTSDDEEDDESENQTLNG